MVLPSNKTAFAAAGVFTVGFTILLFWYNKPELVPQLWISVLAGLLSYLACVFTTEKMRLDLLQQRFEIYEKTLSFCSVVMSQGSLRADKENTDQIDTAIKAAHDSFRGIGWHRTQALFGDDIAALFRQLNEHFAYIVAFGDVRGPEFEAEKYWNRVVQIANLAEALPNHFKRYIYFGDYQRGA